MATLTEIKNFITTAYKNQRSADKFIQTYNGVNFIIVATVRLKTGVAYNSYKDVPVVIPSALKAMALAGLIKEIKNGVALVPFDYLPATIKSNVSFIIEGKTIPYNSSAMTATAVIFSLDAFAAIKTAQAFAQQQLNAIAKSTTNIKNNIEKLKYYYAKMPAGIYRDALLNYAKGAEVMIDSYLTSLYMQDGYIITANKTTKQVNGIGLIPLIIWGIVAIVGLVGAAVVISNKIDRSAEIKKLSDADAATQSLLNYITKVMENPKLTTEQKNTAIKIAADQVKANGQLKTQVEDNASQPGIFDKVENILMLGIGALLIFKLIPNRSN